MTNTEMLRNTMIDGQILPNRVNDPRIISALRTVPRELFVPKALRSVAYIDEDIEVTPGRYLMEPMVFARLVSEADIGENDLVLDVGCTFGYSAAVLAQLASAVVAIEEDQDIVAHATDILLKQEIGNAAVVEAKLNEGYAKEAPYNVIVLEGAVEFIPQALIDQLAEGGRMVGVRVVAGVGRGFVGTKNAGVFGAVDIMDAQVPLLPGFAKPKAFTF